MDTRRTPGGHQALRVKGRENMPNSLRMCKVGEARKQNFDYSYVTLHEECPSTEFLLICIFPYSFRIRENTDQKKLRIWTLFTQCNFKTVSQKLEKSSSFWVPRKLSIFLSETLFLFNKSKIHAKIWNVLKLNLKK